MRWHLACVRGFLSGRAVPPQQAQALVVLHREGIARRVHEETSVSVLLDLWANQAHQRFRN